ncbi:MAG: hypothetical protein R3D70_05785 [Rhizobiaceae bacterium]
MQWLRNLITALVGALVAFYTGKISQQLKDSECELERVEKAMRMAAEHRSDTFDERVQHLKRRGRLRGIPGK